MLEFISRFKAKIKKAMFVFHVRRIKNKDFTIISSNCTGSLFYKLMRNEYLTPTVDLFFYAPCFVKFVENLDYYLSLTPENIKFSKYDAGNINRVANNNYPIARLGDIEIHFLHYDSWVSALKTWQKRKQRVNVENLFFIMTDKDLCSDDLVEKFDGLSVSNKLFLSAKDRKNISCAIKLPFFEGKEEVGNIFSNYHSLYGVFNFKNWFDKKL